MSDFDLRVFGRKGEFLMVCKWRMRVGTGGEMIEMGGEMKVEKEEGS